MKVNNLMLFLGLMLFNNFLNIRTWFDLRGNEMLLQIATNIVGCISILLISYSFENEDN
jgi:hypothetical protein